MAPTLLDLGLAMPRRTAVPSAPAASLPSLPRILICGDADFAYSTALAESLATRLGGGGGGGEEGPEKSGSISSSSDTAVTIAKVPPAPASYIYASAYEPEAELLSRYPNAAENMAALLRRGVNVDCGVDARDLSTKYGGTARFDRIVFNLPQSPPAPKARNQIQRHRALLRDFCGSARSVLAPSGELWITLLAGQGGTPLDPIERSPGDTWQVQLQAASAGLLVTRVDPVIGADLDALQTSGYCPTGRRKEGLPLGAKRKEKGLVVHVLAAEASSADAEAGAAAEGVAPLEWTLDNSFWLHGEAASSPPEGAELLEVCRRALGEEGASDVLAETPALVDAYERPEDGQKARTFRFIYRSSTVALSRERALKLNARVCDALKAQCFLEPRNPEHLASSLE